MGSGNSRLSLKTLPVSCSAVTIVPSSAETFPASQLLACRSDLLFLYICSEERSSSLFPQHPSMQTSCNWRCVFLLWESLAFM